MNVMALVHPLGLRTLRIVTHCHVCLLVDYLRTVTFGVVRTVIMDVVVETICRPISVPSVMIPKSRRCTVRTRTTIICCRRGNVITTNTKSINHLRRHRLQPVATTLNRRIRDNVAEQIWGRGVNVVVFIVIIEGRTMSMD